MYFMHFYYQINKSLRSYLIDFVVNQIFDYSSILINLQKIQPSQTISDEINLIDDIEPVIKLFSYFSKVICKSEKWHRNKIPINNRRREEKEFSEKQPIIEVASVSSSDLEFNSSFIYDPIPLDVSSSEDEIIASERKNKLKQSLIRKLPVQKKEHHQKKEHIRLHGVVYNYDGTVMAQKHIKFDRISPYTFQPHFAVHDVKQKLNTSRHFLKKKQQQPTEETSKTSEIPNEILPVIPQHNEQKGKITEGPSQQQSEIYFPFEEFNVQTGVSLYYTKILQKKGQKERNEWSADKLLEEVRNNESIRLTRKQYNIITDNGNFIRDKKMGLQDDSSLNVTPIKEQRLSSIKPTKSKKKMSNKINITNQNEYSKLMSSDEYQIQPLRKKINQKVTLQTLKTEIEQVEQKATENPVDLFNISIIESQYWGKSASQQQLPPMNSGRIFPSRKLQDKIAPHSNRLKVLLQI